MLKGHIQVCPYTVTPHLDGYQYNSSVLKTSCLHCIELNKTVNHRYKNTCLVKARLQIKHLQKFRLIKFIITTPE